VRSVGLLGPPMSWRTLRIWPQGAPLRFQQLRPLIGAPFRTRSSALRWFKLCSQASTRPLAMLDFGFGFRRPVIDNRVRRQITAVMRAVEISWSLGGHQTTPRRARRSGAIGAGSLLAHAGHPAGPRRSVKPARLLDASLWASGLDGSSHAARPRLGMHRRHVGVRQLRSPISQSC
jgi:hypothetical protein